MPTKRTVVEIHHSLQLKIDEVVRDVRRDREENPDSKAANENLVRTAAELDFAASILRGRPDSEKLAEFSELAAISPSRTLASDVINESEELRRELQILGNSLGRMLNIPVIRQLSVVLSAPVVKPLSIRLNRMLQGPVSNSVRDLAPGIISMLEIEASGLRSIKREEEK